jgi:hypothetical protein
VAIKSFLSQYAQLAVSRLIAGLCRLYVTVLPRRAWYRASLLASRAITFVAGRYMPNRWNIGRSSQTARLLHRFLDRLYSPKGFPIPVAVESENILLKYHSGSTGFLCCTAHLPFVNLVGRLLQDTFQGTRSIKIVSIFPNERNAVPVWNGQEMEALFPDGNVMLQIRRALRQNACVIVLLDKEQGQPVSPNLFHLASRINVPSFLYLPQLLPDGRLESRFLEFPHTVCAGDEQIAENVTFLEDHIDRILGGNRREADHSKLLYPSTQENLRWVSELPRRSSASLAADRQEIQAKLDANQYEHRNRYIYVERIRIINLELAARSRTEAVSAIAEVAS